MTEDYKLTPLHCFLHRIFPGEHYDDQAKKIVENKIFQPRKDNEPFELSFPVDWESISKNSDRNWRMQLQGWTMFHPIMNFFDNSLEKEKILDYFFSIAKDWYHKYKEDSAHSLTTRMPDSYAWYDMSVGFRALVIGFFLNRIKFYRLNITQSQEELLNEIAFKHIKNLSFPKAFSLNNHGMFQIQGLMSLIQHFGIKKYKKEFNYALKQMEALAFSQFDENGVHLEHSPHYHFYALSTFKCITLNNWYDQKPSIKNIISKANDVQSWIVDPYKRPACIGDSILTEQQSIDFQSIKQKENENQQLYIKSNFDNSGYSIFRSNWMTAPEKSTYFFFMGAYHSKTHKHRDCLSFEWFDKGEKIICDSGKYGYVSDKYRHYFLSNKAHNTVEIEDFDILKIKPYHSSIKQAEIIEEDIFNVHAALEYPAVNFDRQTYLKPGRFLIIIDTLSFKRKRNATQWLHFNKNYKLKSFQDKNIVLEKKDNKKELYITCLNKRSEPIIYDGDHDNMQGFISEKDYQYSDAIAIGFKVHTDSEKIITIIALEKEYEIEARKYISTLDSTYQTELPSVFQKKNTFINDLPHYTFCGLDALNLSEKKSTYTISESKWELSFYADIKPQTKKTIIMLPGATNREKSLFSFQRRTWSGEFDENIISFSDPTVTESHDISIGWFQGRYDNYAFDNLVQVIKEIVKKLEIKESDIVFFGSSAGGFIALQLANIFKKSITISINPQIYLYNYNKTHFNKIMSYCYPTLTLHQALKSYGDRLKITTNFSERSAPSFIFQNTHDIHHMNKHLGHFLKHIDKKLYSVYQKSIKNESKLNVVYYDDEKLKHSPPDKETTIKYIKSCLQWI